MKLQEPEVQRDVAMLFPSVHRLGKGLQAGTSTGGVLVCRRSMGT